MAKSKHLQVGSALVVAMVTGASAFGTARPAGDSMSVPRGSAVSSSSCFPQPARADPIGLRGRSGGVLGDAAVVRRGGPHPVSRADGVAHGPAQDAVNFFRVDETHLPLRGVHVHVDRLGWDLDKNQGCGKTSAGQDIAVDV